MADWYEVAGTRVRQRREQMGFSMARVAQFMRRRGHDSITPATQRKIERGQRRVFAAEIPDYCRVLNCPLWWLLGMDRDEAIALDADWNATQTNGR